MSGSRKPRRVKAQTAVEMLFILGVVLAGVVVIVPVYLQQNSDSTMVAAIRDAASQAAAYINTGVITNDSKYAPLNVAISGYTGYSNPGLRFVGIRIQSENSTTVVVDLKFDHTLSPNSRRDGKIALAIGDFIKGYLKGISGFKPRGGHLYVRNRLLEFNVTVCETWVVVS